MEDIKVTTGFNVALNVDAALNGWKYLIDELKEAEIKPINPKDAHTTIVYPDEFKMSIITSDDREAYDNAYAKVRSYLTGLCVDKDIVTPTTERVIPFQFKRSKVGVLLVEQELMLDTRSDIKNIIQEETKKIIKDEHTYISHITLGDKNQKYRSKKIKEGKSFMLPASPKFFAVTGFSIQERTLEVVDTQSHASSNLTPRYRNKPPSLRRVS